MAWHRRFIRVTVFLFLISAVLAPLPPRSPARVFATGGWNGQNSFSVPMAWCVVAGSPAAANPNIAGDTTTDDVIWRRNERPTDGIFANNAGVSLRSAITGVAGPNANFPIIADPSIPAGTVSGDMRGETNAMGQFANPAEYNTLVNNCDAAWAAPPPNGPGLAGIGVTAVNARRFHDGANPANYVNIIGWAGCAQVAGDCAAPYDGRLVVNDNSFLFPGAANQFFVSDPLDQLVAHEFGHAVSLAHVIGNTNAMMFGTSTDNDGDGAVDNIAMTNAEVTDIRNNVQNIPGVQIDPEGVFEIGRYVASRQVDAVQENPDLQAHFDISSIRIAYDKQEDQVIVDQQLFGLIPPQRTVVEGWFLLDMDGPELGMDEAFLEELGVPPTEFVGTDIIARITIRNGDPSGEAWQFSDQELVRIEGFIPELLTMRLYPHYAPLPGQPLEFDIEVTTDVFHILRVTLPNNEIGLTLGEPFRMQAFVLQPGNDLVDRLNDDDEADGVDFVVDNPQFPECVALGDGTPGQTAEVELRKLRPDAPIHGLFGPTAVFEGMTDDEGGGVIDLPIPIDATAGYHLVTVGVDGTALTADCLLNVVRDDDRPITESLPEDRFALIVSYEDLLRRQQMLMTRLGVLLEDMSTRDDVSVEQYLALVEAYTALLEKQGILLEVFGELLQDNFE